MDLGGAGDHIYIYIYISVNLFERSLAEPRRTFVAGLLTDLCNSLSLVTYPDACPDSQRYSTGALQTFAEHALDEESTCRELAIQKKSWDRDSSREGPERSLSQPVT